MNRREERRQEEHLDLDRLYEQKRKRNLREVAVYGRILTKVIRRINRTAQDPITDKRGLVFPVPAYIPGEFTYNASRCAAWLVTELEDRNLRVMCDMLGGERVLYVSWKHYIPQFEREEIRRRTGLIVDANGVVVPDAPDENESDEREEAPQARKRTFTPLHDFKPTRAGIYNEEQLRGIVRKF